MSKTAIIVDSTCNLPRQICEKYNVSFVPIKYTIDGVKNADPCKDDFRVKLFQSGRLGRKHDVSTEAPTVKEFEQAIAEKINQGFTHIIVQTVNRTMGDTYKNANTAVGEVNRRLKDKSVTVRVMDSRTVFAGQGLMAVETIRRLLQEKSVDAARRKMDVLSEKIHTFIIPKDIVTARERGVKRNENNISWMQARLANALNINPIICNSNDDSYVPAKIVGFNKAARSLFEHACKRIEAGLLSPVVTISYAGPLEELKALPGYAELADLAQEKKLILIPSVASITNAVYATVGSLSVALATEPHEWA